MTRINPIRLVALVAGMLLIGGVSAVRAEVPWANWFYNTDHKRDQVNALYEQAIDLRNTLQADGIKLKADIQLLKQFATVNSALLYISNTAGLSDEEFAKYEQDIAALPDAPNDDFKVDAQKWIGEKLPLGQAIVLKLGWSAGTKLGTYLFERTFFPEAAPALVASQITKGLVQSGIAQGSVTLLKGAEQAVVAGTVKATVDVGKTVTLATVKAAFAEISAASLATTGIGIFAAVGIDAIFGAINGAKERDELDRHIADLKSALEKAAEFRQKHDDAVERTELHIDDQQAAFKSTIGVLAKTKQPNAAFASDANLSTYDAFAKAQQAALSQYSSFVELRKVHTNALKRDPQITKAAVIDNVLMTSPPEITQAMLEENWAILSKSSALMRGAK